MSLGDRWRSSARVGGLTSASLPGEGVEALLARQPRLQTMKAGDHPDAGRPLVGAVIGDACSSSWPTVSQRRFWQPILEGKLPSWRRPRGDTTGASCINFKCEALGGAVENERVNRVRGALSSAGGT